MPARPQTKPSTFRLSEAARHVVVPKGAVSTGWPAVCQKCAEFGVSFRPWQAAAGSIILAKREDGTYASTIGGTGLSIPRQVGKTFLVGAIIFALCILLPNLTVIWTAHRLRTAEETFGKMQVFAKRRLIRPHILRVILGSGEEEIRFRNGSRILFGARERGFGRGFDEVDVLIFDEAQMLPESALDDMVPATNQSRQPTGALLLFMGTPPKPTDRGEVFLRMRTEALTGEDEDSGWIEFGADPHFRPTPLPAQLTAADWAQVTKANPSFPHDTPRESILRMRKKLGPESFLREGLGIWDEDAENLWRVIPKEVWVGRAGAEGRPAGPVVFALSASWPHADWGSISVAGQRGDEVYVQVVEHLPGTSWMPRRIKELEAAWDPAAIMLDDKDPAAREKLALAKASITVTPLTTTEATQAYGMFIAAVMGDEPSLRHYDQARLNQAVASAEAREVGDAHTWVRKGPHDVSPLVAATHALWGYSLYGGDGLGVDDVYVGGI